jgi:uncharacterized protein (DUF4415 family)
MTGKRGYTSRDLKADEAPDLSAPRWAKKLAAAKVKRGRPKAAVTKVSTTIRIDPDVLEAFRAEGPGWQARMNAVLRKAIKKRA